MLATTTACARFESKGKPDLTETLIDATVADIVRAQTRWLLATPMGHHIRVTIARSAAELEDACRVGGNKRSAAVAAEDLASDIAALLDGLPDGMTQED